MPKKLILVSACAVVVLVTTIVLVLLVAHEPLPQSPAPGKAEIRSTSDRPQKTSSPDQTELQQRPSTSQEDDEDSSSAPLFADVDPVTELKLQPWVDAYFADRKDADYITDFQLVDPSYELLTRIRRGEVASFQVLSKGSGSIQVEVIEVGGHSSSWSAWGSSPDHPGSIAEFTIDVDGSINAVISLPGIGQYGIRPSGELPYHLMYFTHGVSSYD